MSIIDLSTNADQPMAYADRYWITFNGEIYNYVELREELERAGWKFRTRSDTEVLLAAYAAWGEACFERLEGMWAIGIYDRHDDSLVLCRDPYGIKPLYIAQHAGATFFASEIKAILTMAPGMPVQPDLSAVSDFLAYQITDHDERTFFEGVSSLAPGHLMRCTPTGAGTAAWFKPDRTRRPPPDDAAAEFERRFRTSVSIHMRSDVPVGFCVSGGLDSSTIAGVARHVAGPEASLHGFAAVFPGSAADEEPFIDAVLQHNHMAGHKITPRPDGFLDELPRIMWHLDQPVPASSVYAHWEVMRLANQARVKVLLDGQGPDEYLAGYYYFYSYLIAGLLRKGQLRKAWRESRALARMQHRRFEAWAALFLLLPAQIQRVAYGHAGWRTRALRRHAMKSTYVETVVSARDLDASLAVALGPRIQHLLRYEDRNSMAFGIETRLPYLVPMVTEYGLALPPAMKLRDGVNKRVARDALGSYLPALVRNRLDKKGFEVDSAAWLRQPATASRVRGMLLGPGGLQGRGLIRPKVIRRTLARHLAGTADHSKLLVQWICLEEWFRVFIDAANGRPPGAMWSLRADGSRRWSA